MVDYNSNLLILNIVLWVLMLIWYLKKYKHFGAGGLLISAFIFYSVCSYPIFFDTEWNYFFKDLKLFPLLLHVVLIVISFIPIFKWDGMKVNEIKVHNYSFIKLVCWFFVICTIMRVGDLTTIYSGIMEMMAGGGADVYNETMSESLHNSGNRGISNVFSIFSNLLYGICTLFFFFLLMKKERNKFLIWLLVISFIISILIPIAISQRGPALNRALLFLGTYFIMKDYLPKKITKIVSVSFITIGVLLLVPILYITFARFEDRGALNSLCYYFGEQNIYFNNYALDNNGIRYGDRVFPMFKEMLGFENIPADFWERRFKYPHLKINDEVFIGYVGDLFLDFGPIIASLIIIIYSWFCVSKLKIKNGVLYLYQLLPINILMHICLFGGLFLFPYADGGNLELMMYILMYLVLKYFKI